MTEHGPWARAEFAAGRLWLACECGWNAMGDGQGTYDEHIAAAGGGSLDAAWAEAEAASREIGAVVFERTHYGDDMEWRAIVSESGWLGEGLTDEPSAYGPTPAAALKALAESLRAVRP